MLEQADPGLVRSLRGAASHACPVIVVRGLAEGLAPPTTPYDGIVDLAASRQAIINLYAVVGCLGLHPVGYAKESASTLHAVCPVRTALGEASSHGFDAALPMHTDYADRPIDEPIRDQSPAAAALAFAVERAELATPMQCVPAHRLWSLLSPEQIAAGCLEEFAVRAPALFGGSQSGRARRLFLPDSRSPNSRSGIRCRLNLGTMTGLTPRATRLLHEIREILSDATMIETIHVRRGDIVIMDNQRTFHRRASFTPRWDGTDRYFIRMSAVHDCRAGLAADPRRPWIWS
jgi:TfdA family taurine catabolism dioxygenase TauD